MPSLRANDSLRSAIQVEESTDTANKAAMLVSVRGIF